MGLLGWLNRRGNEVLDPVMVDPAFKRADRALEKGAAAGATVVGIEQKLDDGTTTRFVAVGVTDKAVDWADQRRLAKWTPRRATITALSRRDGVMGPTLDFDVALRLDDGAQVVAGDTAIPFYAAWRAAPG